MLHGMKTRRRVLEFFGAAALVGCGASESSDLSAKGPEMTARQAGYRMPLESERHERTFMQWPVHASVYGGRRYLEDVQSSIALIANTIAEFEPVVMLGAAADAARIASMISEKVEHWAMATDDLWCRDAGPTFVRSRDGALGVSELNFNGWGGKQRHENDASIARAVAERLDLPLFDSRLVGEGGGVETDGAGTLIAHESCWVNKNRNKLTRDEIEKRLLGAFGAEKMIWAPGVKGKDITDYHIDSLARYIRPGEILIQLPATSDLDGVWSAAAYDTYEILRQATDARGDPLEIVTIPEPVRIRSRLRDFVASYANYYVCNGAVIAAEFGDKDADEEARTALAGLYPGREIISLNIDPIGEAGGGVHCATQQQPTSSAH